MVEDHRVSDDQIPAIQDASDFCLLQVNFRMKRNWPASLLIATKQHPGDRLYLVQRTEQEYPLCSRVPPSTPVLTLGDSGSQRSRSISHPCRILNNAKFDLPIWIRNRDQDRLFPKDNLFSGRLLDSAVLSGSLLCDGLGDLISVENLDTMDRK